MYQKNKESEISRNQVFTEENLLYSQYSGFALIIALFFVIYTIALAILWCICFSSWAFDKVSIRHRKQ